MRIYIAFVLIMRMLFEDLSDLYTLITGQPPETHPLYDPVKGILYPPPPRIPKRRVDPGEEIIDEIVPGERLNLVNGIAQGSINIIGGVQRIITDRFEGWGNTLASIFSNDPTTWRCDGEQPDRIRDSMTRIRNIMFGGEDENVCHDTIIDIGGEDLWDCLSSYIILGDFTIICADNEGDPGFFGCSVADILHGEGTLGYTYDVGNIMVFCPIIWDHSEGDPNGPLAHTIMHELSHFCGIPEANDADADDIGEACGGW